jgi:hypothetical protein
MTIRIALPLKALSQEGTNTVNAGIGLNIRRGRVILNPKSLSPMMEQPTIKPTIGSFKKVRPTCEMEE